VPNHHADYPRFGGIGGLAAAVSMLFRRDKTTRLACDLVHLTPADDVVDIGCGPGAAAREAARRGASVVGIDPAPVMLTVARRTTRPGVPIRWLEGSAENLPLADGATSVAWGLATVHHWADVAAALVEIDRVLRPDGRLLVVERRVQPGATGHASHGWTDAQAEAFAAACRQSGLESVVVARHALRRGSVLSVLATRSAGTPGA
jgi:ubiquinone/menaquinone biosynthesis C-methylase UbiE